MKKILLFVASLLCFSGPLRAVDSNAVEKPPLPTGPLPARAASFASWKISYTYDPLAKSAAKAGPAAPVSAAPPQPKEIFVTKTGTSYHSVEIFDNGSVLNRWWINGAQLTGRKTGPYLFSEGNDLSLYLINYHVSDFPEIAWIGAECYTGVETVHGVKCFAFKKQISADSEAVLQRMTPGERAVALKNLRFATAWIDLETRLPVEVSLPDQHAIYTFLPLPSEAVRVPPEGARQMEAWQTLNRRLTEPRVGP